MNLKDFLLAELDREVERSRRALEQVPEGKSDWKPHEKSMAFGYLANMVATIPMWVTMQLTMDELDIAPKDGGKFEMKPLNTSAEYVEALDKAAAGAIRRQGFGPGWTRAQHSLDGAGRRRVRVSSHAGLYLGRHHHREQFELELQFELQLEYV